MKMKSVVIASIILLFITSCNKQQYTYPFLNPDLPIDERIDDLLGRLTPEEKVGQMMNQTPAIERLGIPPYDWWNEALHGVARAGRATVFPQAIALAATFDENAVYTTFDMVSDEARAKYHQYQKNKEYDRYKGLTFWTPNINIFRDPRWGRGMETYGEDPYLTARMGVAVVKGLQGNNPDYFKTHACAKHYAVHSGPEWSRHEFNAVATPRDLYLTYLPAFKALVEEANVQEVMCAYNRFEGKPCCNSDKLLIDILRNDWGYQNIILSDCGAINDFWEKDPNTPRHETHPDAESASSDAVRSGTDLECGDSYQSLIQALKDGKIMEKDLDVSLRRLLKGRFELGMFDPDERVPYAKIPYSVVESPQHIAQALDMARKSIVLLKNKNDLLPLSKKIKKIAVVGPNAADSTMLWANYNGFPTRTVTILDGIRNKMPEAEIIYELGCNHTGKYIKSVAGSDSVLVDCRVTADRVKEADIIIYAGGISPRLEGEEMPVDEAGFHKGDRTDLELPAIQKEMIKALKATQKPVVYVVCTGSALALNWENENIDAIVNAWYGGQEAGTAVADVLFGDYNPAGRLPVTFYTSVSQLPDFQDYHMQGRTYRYMTQKPLYPFGYGLSYTSFEYRNARLSNQKIGIDQPVTLSFHITNTGKMDGDEVAQVYIKNPNDPEGPIKTLKAFKRVNIKAGETKQIDIRLEPETFASFNDQTQTMEVRPGNYQILYGSSSADQDLKSIDLTIK
ncbi:glycoside hydrolase family 3 C-terminal domain-containing protein [Parabacteroides bouchesdurhonensis]|uniref:glycoside hydrolase family 3 C-terminal domain-containing protein n=1 Tax=Parabacteroides bouchesdurhonensis TaxID=1936995 RepID=UPI000C828B35|nr:glycoside hydrolase family 3 C-terminal domain-containing protein [Parabacteroides bouchesdurhonensis]